MTEWHSYAHKGQSASVRFLILASMVLAAGWGWIQQHWALPIPWWVDTPAVLGFYAFLFWVYDLRGWTWLRRIHGVPDYSGEYSVIIRSSFDEHAAEHQGKLKIKQSWTQILIRLETDTSVSMSQGGYMVEVPGEGYRLVYLYHNTPKGASIVTMQQHDGTADILFSIDGVSATGLYYTGRGRLNHGELVLRRTSDHA